MGAAIPDLAIAEPETRDEEVVLYNADLGEYGVCTYTYYGGRGNPESRLRRFPVGWRAEWETGDALIFVRVASDRLAYVLHHRKPGTPLPVGLTEVSSRIRAGSTHDVFELGAQTGG